MYVLFGENVIRRRSYLARPNPSKGQKAVESELPDLASLLPESLEKLHFAGTRERVGISIKAIERLVYVKQAVSRS